MEYYFYIILIKFQIIRFLKKWNCIFFYGEREREYYPFPKTNKFRLDPLLVELVIIIRKEKNGTSAGALWTVQSRLVFCHLLSWFTTPCAACLTGTGWLKNPIVVTGLSFLLSARNANLGAQLVPGPGIYPFVRVAVSVVCWITSYDRPCPKYSLAGNMHCTSCT